MQVRWQTTPHVPSRASAEKPVTMGGSSGFSSYNDHAWAINHSARDNPHVRVPGRNPLRTAAPSAIEAERAAEHEHLKRFIKRSFKRTTDDSTCAFSPTPRFEGHRPGMVFKKSVRGQGYYADDGHWTGEADSKAHEEDGAIRLFLDIAERKGRSMGRVIVKLWNGPRACGWAGAGLMALVVGGATEMEDNPKETLAGASLHRAARGQPMRFHGRNRWTDPPEGAEAMPAPSDAGLEPARHARGGLLSGRWLADGRMEFVLTLAAAPHLDGTHPVVGEVTDGMQVLYEIDGMPLPPAGDAGTGDGPGNLIIAACGLCAGGEDGDVPHGSWTVDAARSLGTHKRAQVEEAIRVGMTARQDGTVTGAKRPLEVQRTPANGPTHAAGSRVVGPTKVSSRWDSLGDHDDDSDDDDQQ